jgi:hypothetical protein
MFDDFSREKSMPGSQGVSNLPKPIQDALQHSVKEKFNAYFEYTKPLNRFIPCPEVSPGACYFPTQSIMSDLTILSALFGETFQAFAGLGKLNEFAKLVQGDRFLQGCFKDLIDGPEGVPGSFWHTLEGPPKKVEQVSSKDAVEDAARILEVLRTLRNGFLHFHWRFNDLTGADYWAAQGWSTGNEPPEFTRANPSGERYVAYIADAKSWDASEFWDQNDLRILVTSYSLLRKQLHLILNYILNGERVNVFGNPAAICAPP